MPGLPHSLRAAVGRQAPRSLRGKAEVLAGLMVLEVVGEEAGRLSSLVGEEVGGGPGRRAHSLRGEEPRNLLTPRSLPALV